MQEATKLKHGIELSIFFLELLYKFEVDFGQWEFTSVQDNYDVGGEVGLGILTRGWKNLLVIMEDKFIMKTQKGR